MKTNSASRANRSNFRLAVSHDVDVRHFKETWSYFLFFIDKKEPYNTRYHIYIHNLKKSIGWWGHSEIEILIIKT